MCWVSREVIQWLLPLQTFPLIPFRVSTITKQPSFLLSILPTLPFETLRSSYWPMPLCGARGGSILLR